MKFNLKLLILLLLIFSFNLSFASCRFTASGAAWEVITGPSGTYSPGSRMKITVEGTAADVPGSYSMSFAFGKCGGEYKGTCREFGVGTNPWQSIGIPPMPGMKIEKELFLPTQSGDYDLGIWLDFGSVPSSGIIFKCGSNFTIGVNPISEKNNPPTKPVISGPKNIGKLTTGIDGKLTYSEWTFKSDDPEKDKIYYEIKSKDDQGVDWNVFEPGKILTCTKVDSSYLNCYDSGQSGKYSGGWRTVGQKILSVRAIDYRGAASEWSDYEIEVGDASPQMIYLNGPLTLKINESGQYKFKGIDPEDSTLFYSPYTEETPGDVFTSFRFEPKARVPSGTEENVSVSYQTPGEKTLKVRARDASGNYSAYKEINIEVLGPFRNPPTVSFAGDSQVGVNNYYCLSNITATDLDFPSNDAVGFKFDWGDGAIEYDPLDFASTKIGYSPALSGTEVQPFAFVPKCHIYGTAGTKKILVTVIDKGDNLGQAEKNVLVAVEPLTLTFTGNPLSIDYNTASTLTWSSTNASSCTASGDWTGAKTLSGSQSTGNLTTNKSYTITCTGAGGSVSKTVNITVGSQDDPTLTFTANPLFVLSGQSSTLTWYTTNVSFCYSRDWGTTPSKPTSGSITEVFTFSKLFDLTCIGTKPNTSVYKRVLVSVISIPTLTFTGNPLSIDYNTASTLTWSSTNASSCTASGDWTTAMNFGGSLSGSRSTGNLTTNKSYTITCTNPVGSVSKTVNITVGAAPTPTLTFTGNPLSIDYNTASTLTWSSTNASSCTASGDWTGAKTLSGSQSTGNLTTNKSYTITCTGAGGSVSKTVNITVGAAPYLDIGLRIKAIKSEFICGYSRVGIFKLVIPSCYYESVLSPIKIAAEPGTPTSPLRIKRNTSSGIKTFGIALVPPGDPNATGWIVKVKDKNGVLKPMALRKL